MLFRQAGSSLSGRWICSAGIALLIVPAFAAPPTGAAPPRPNPVTRTPQKPAPVPAQIAPASSPVLRAPAPVRPTRKRIPAPARPTAAPETADPVASGLSEAEESPTKPAPAAERETKAAGKTEGEFADAWPSVARSTATDLQLKPEDTRKAEAFTAFARGLVAEDAAEPEAMLANYRRALELDPSNAELAVKVAYELARRNDAPAGIQILKDAIKAAPKEPLPYIYLSQLYSKYLKKADLAQTYADQAVALAPHQFTGYLALVELHEAAGQKQKADAVLERALKNDTKDPRFWLQFGDHLQKRHVKEDGSAAPEELKRMNAIFAKAAELGKDDAYVLGKVADYHVMSKQIEGAIPFYRAVLKLPAHPENPGAGIFREKLARALVYTNQKDEARDVLEELLRENPQRFEYHELLGELYEDKGDLEKAMAHYEYSLQLDASEPRNHLRLTNLLRQAKQYDRAVEMLQLARKKWPDQPSLTYWLALSLSQAKRHQEALQAFADAQADAENRDEELLNATFYFTYGAAAEQAGDLQKAIELLKQSIDLDPNSADAYNYLGYMWADRGEHLDEAHALLKKAVELEPDNGAYLDSLGWLYFKQGNAENALKELLRAQENIVREYKLEDATVLDHIGDVYSKLGKNGEALHYWQKALTVENDDDKLRGKIAEKLESAKQKVTAAPSTAPTETTQ